MRLSSQSIFSIGFITTSAICCAKHVNTGLTYLISLPFTPPGSYVGKHSFQTRHPENPHPVVLECASSMGYGHMAVLFRLNGVIYSCWVLTSSSVKWRMPLSPPPSEEISNQRRGWYPERRLVLRQEGTWSKGWYPMRRFLLREEHDTQGEAGPVGRCSWPDLACKTGLMAKVRWDAKKGFVQFFIPICIEIKSNITS